MADPSPKDEYQCLQADYQHLRGILENIAEGTPYLPPHMKHATSEDRLRMMISKIRELAREALND